MKILNFGALNIDYVYTVEHFVTAGETIKARKLETFCGGKGLNQSVALARAGAQTFHAGHVGPEGGMLTDLLKAAGADVTHVGVSRGPSGHAIIQVDGGGENCILINGGANDENDAAFAESVLSHFGPGDICLLQNEIAGVPAVMQAAHAHGLAIAFNPSPITDAVADYPLRCVRYFILNEGEGRGISGQTEPEAIADTLLSRYPGCRVVLTLGKRGVFYKDAEQTARHGIYRVPRVDTTGAGDTFAGFFLASAAAGLPVTECLRRASVASSLAVSRKGAAVSIPTLTEVLAARLEAL